MACLKRLSTCPSVSCYAVWHGIRVPGMEQVYPLPAVVAGPEAPYAVITGGSSGIGRAVADEVCFAAACTATAAGRSMSKTTLLSHEIAVRSFPWSEKWLLWLIAQPTHYPLDTRRVQTRDGASIRACTCVGSGAVYLVDEARGSCVVSSMPR